MRSSAYDDVTQWCLEGTEVWRKRLSGEGGNPKGGVGEGRG